MLRAGLKRGLGLQRRGFSGSVGSGPPSGKRAVEEYDEAKYGGWKSTTILFAEEPERKPLVARWDWHVVQFLLAMIPPGLVLLIVQWARHDMRQVDARREKEALEKESEKLAAVMAHQQQTSPGGHAGAPAGATAAAAAPKLAAAAGAGAASGSAPSGGGSGQGGDEVQVRLSRLEALVQQLVEQQAAKVDAALEREASQRQQAAAAAAAAQSAPGPGGREQQQQQQQQQQQVQAGRQQEDRQQTRQPEQNVQQGPWSVLQQAQPAWRWVRARLGGAAPQATPPPAASSREGGKGGGEASSESAGSGTSAVQPAPPQLADGAAAGVGAVQAPAQAPAAAAAAPAAGATREGTPAAAKGRPADGRAPPATAAQWLLHSVGAPLRWLRQRDAGPPS